MHITRVFVLQVDFGFLVHTQNRWEWLIELYYLVYSNYKGYLCMFGVAVDFSPLEKVFKLWLAQSSGAEGTLAACIVGGLQ